MRILGFDTATSATTAALCDDAAGISLEARDDPPAGARPRHATLLLSQIVGLLDRASTGWDAIDRIAVGVGPGTFTGLRIGIATARALGAARDIPLTGVSSLQSLALGACGASGACDTILAAIDARRGEAFVAAWRSDGDRLGERLIAPRALGPDALHALAGALPGKALAIGSGAVEFLQLLERAGALVPAPDSQLHRVTAVNHCRLALGAPGRAHGEIQPEYLRPPDAEIALRERTTTPPHRH
jgi:tRNA threonylcarbamoyladenosine biosynthesis protein TsaB